MSLNFDRKGYGYNETSHVILFDAKDDDTIIHFGLPRVALADYVRKGLENEAEMWEAFHAAQTHIEQVAADYWRVIAAQHLREGTAAPLGTPLVLPTLDPSEP